jgi:hypothetical protein
MNSLAVVEPSEPRPDARLKPDDLALRIVDAHLQMADGTKRRPNGKGEGSPLDEWFTEFRNPP